MTLVRIIIHDMQSKIKYDYTGNKYNKYFSCIPNDTFHWLISFLIESSIKRYAKKGSYYTSLQELSLKSDFTLTDYVIIHYTLICACWHCLHTPWNVRR